MNNSTARALVAICLGSSLFTVLFMFVKIPSPVPETNFQIAYGVSSVFGTLFGGLCGFLVAFAGHMMNDYLAYGSPWWSWIIASGVSAAICGGATSKIAETLKSGVCGLKEFKIYAMYAVLGHAVSWLIVAPLLDIFFYKTDVLLAFRQGVTAFIMDSICAVLFGGVLLKIYSAGTKWLQEE